MAEFTDKPGYAFGEGPPKAVSDFLRLKENRPSFAFREVEPEEHAVAFTVAKSAGFDILDDVREALQRALDRGETFETFRKSLEPTLVAKGWWGRKVVRAPDGRQAEVQLGSLRRLRTIYRANMRAARAAGQWERIERTKGALPYLVYLLGPSERHRPHHAAKAGWVLPVDHPFWNEWMPPNGWGCKCHVRQIGAAEAERRGITRQVAIPRRPVRNPATGAVRELPGGLDPAWAGNPGKTRLANAEAFLADKLEAAEETVARVAARDVARSWRVERLHAGAAPGWAPVARAPAEIAAAIGARTRVVRYSAEDAAKMRREHPDATIAPLAELHDAMAAEPGLWVFPDAARPTHLTVWREIEGKLWLFALKATRDGAEIYLNSFYRKHPAALEKERRRWRERSPGR